MQKKEQKISKIQIHVGDSQESIISVFKKLETKKAIFCFPRHFSALADIKFLRKLHNAASEAKKEFSIFAPKFFSRFISDAKIEHFTELSPELKKQPSKKIDHFFEKIEATKNLTEKISNPRRARKSTSRPQFSLRKIESTSSERSVRGWIFFGFVGLILLLGVVFLWISPSARIEIKPKISTIETIQNILIRLQNAKIPKKNLELPTVDGIWVETEISGNEIFPTTGRKYQLTNAHGKVTIFNETNRQKIFIPSRLSTADGVIFRFKNKIVVPPKKDNEPGRIAIEVFADEYDEKNRPIGERGNIDAGTELFFPALRTESRELWYARANLGPLTGGSTLTKYFLAETDGDAARERLKDMLIVRGKSKLREEVENKSNRDNKKFVLLDDPRVFYSELFDFKYDTSMINTETQTFEVSAKLKLRSVIFDQNSVVDLMASKMRERQDRRKKLMQIDASSMQYELMEFDKMDSEKWIKLSVELFGVESLDFSGNTEEAVEFREELKREIAGKTISEARGILTNLREIDSVNEIKISPFWAKSIPVFLEKIEFVQSSDD